MNTLPRLSFSFMLLLAGMLSCLSCKEKFECSAENTVNIPQVMKDCFYFKEGTWWVYKNIKNKPLVRLDSQSVF